MPLFSHFFLVTALKDKIGACPQPSPQPSGRAPATQQHTGTKRPQEQKLLAGLGPSRASAPRFGSDGQEALQKAPCWRNACGAAQASEKVACFEKNSEVRHLQGASGLQPGWAGSHGLPQSPLLGDISLFIILFTVLSLCVSKLKTSFSGPGAQPSVSHCSMWKRIILLTCDHIKNNLTARLGSPGLSQTPCND